MAIREFNCNKISYSKGQEFDYSKDIVEQGGEKINLFELTQESREDTEIYKVIEKYGIDGAIKALEDPSGVYMDTTNIGDLKDMKTAEIELTNQWNKLPADLKSQFNNDKYQFMREAPTKLVEWQQLKDAPVAIKDAPVATNKEVANLAKTEGAKTDE